MDAPTSASPPAACPFCSPANAPIVARGEHAVAFFDRFPSSPGHALVVPRRHMAFLFDLTEPERAAVWALVAEVREVLTRSHRPGGFNVGVNDGEAAGHPVGHADVHVIPRYAGDAADALRLTPSRTSVGE